MRNKIEIPEIVQKIAQVFKDNGNKSFVVGGYVRDSIMFKESKDIDIATDLYIDDVINLFKDLDITKDIMKTGDKFPVARIFTNCGEEFEIATFRSDISEVSYTLEDFLSFLKENDIIISEEIMSNLRNDKWEETSNNILNKEFKEFKESLFLTGKDIGFKIVSDIKEDVNRRDFTFNALFADALTGEVIDLVGGLDDLKNKTIKFVGDPIKRIKEDRTRLLRLIRFKEKFEFKVEDGLLIKDHNTLIDGLDVKDQVKKEMIVNEMIKGNHQAKNSISFFNSLLEFGLLQQAFPSLLLKKPIHSSTNIETMLVQILWDNDPKEIELVLHRMKWSSVIISRIVCFINIKNLDVQGEFEGLSRLIKKIESSESTLIFSEFFIEKMLDYDKSSLVKVMLRFNLTVKKEMFPNIPNGIELGKAIHSKEVEILKETIKKYPKELTLNMDGIFLDMENILKKYNYKIGSCKDSVEIQQISLFCMNNPRDYRKPVLIDLISPMFSFAGLYPNTMKTFNIKPDL